MDWNNKEEVRQYMRQYAKEWRSKHAGYPVNTDAAIMRACTKCKVEKPATAEFFEKEKTRLLGVSSHCKECKTKRSAKWNSEHREHVTERQRAWREKNKEQCVRRERVRSLKKYDITPEQYDALLNAQGGVCAICNAPPDLSSRKRLAVDHDHATERNRGLLCTMCNHALERIENDPEWGTKALNYLAKFIEQTVR